jgi:DNA-binding transcriptional LysR family regulator
MEQSERTDFNHLQTFYWVAKTEGFTAAARALSLPKSTVSRHIALLEQRLRTRLIERTTRRIALTEIGKLYLAHCERVMADAEDAERAIAAYGAEPRGLLRVGVPVTFARSFLSPLLPDFCRKYPEVKLDLVLGGGNRLDPLEALLDVVIHVGRLKDSSYVVRKLGAMPLHLYASRQYLAKNKAPLHHPKDLEKHSVISGSRTPGGLRWKLHAADGRRQDVSLDPRLSVADPVISQQLAASGLGVAVLPEFLTKDTKNLVRVLPDWCLEELEFLALYPERQLMAPKLRVFLKELEARLSFNPDRQTHRR